MYYVYGDFAAGNEATKCSFLFTITLQPSFSPLTGALDNARAYYILT